MLRLSNLFGGGHLAEIRDLITCIKQDTEWNCEKRVTFAETCEFFPMLCAEVHTDIAFAVRSSEGKHDCVEVGSRVRGGSHVVAASYNHDKQYFTGNTSTHLSQINPYWRRCCVYKKAQCEGLVVTTFWTDCDAHRPQRLRNGPALVPTLGYRRLVTLYCGLGSVRP